MRHGKSRRQRRFEKRERAVRRFLEKVAQKKKTQMYDSVSAGREVPKDLNVERKTALLDQDISVLKLSPGTEKILRKNWKESINVVADIIRLGKTGLRGIPYIGPKKGSEIDKALVQVGLSKLR